MTSEPRAPRIRILVGLIFLVGVAASLAPAFPGIRQINGLSLVPIQAPLLGCWLILVAILYRRVRLIAVAMALLVTSAVSTALTPDLTTVRTWVGTLVLPVAVWHGLALLDDRDLRQAQRSLSAALALVSGWQVISFLQAGGWSDLLPKGVYRVHSDAAFWAVAGEHVLGNPNNASVIFVSGVAWGTYQLTRSRRDWLAWVCTGASFAAVYVTGSRGAALVAVLVVTIPVAVAIWHTRFRWFVVAIPLAAIAVGAVVLAQGGSLIASVDTRGGTRVAALPALATVFGHGPGTTAASLKPYLDKVHLVGVDRTGLTSHDMFMNWTVCLGLAGLVALLAILVTFVVRIARHPELRWAAVLPLLGYLLAAEASGIDVLTSTNAAWATLLFVLIGIGWGGSTRASSAHRVLGQEADEPSALGAGAPGGDDEVAPSPSPRLAVHEGQS